MSKEYTVYIGKKNNKIVYVGTTIQIPEDRFRWHKYNGKDLDFEVVEVFDNAEDMLNKELELITTFNPELNKITHRKQNLNVNLTEEELEKRKGSPEWCQKCLKRRVNNGYKYCYYCGK